MFLLKLIVKQILLQEQSSFKILQKILQCTLLLQNPISVKREDIPSDIIEKEKEIFAELTRKEGKPENIIDKIVKGRLDKFFPKILYLNKPTLKILIRLFKIF